MKREHVVVLMEDVKSKFDAVTEMFSSLRDRIDLVRDELHRHAEENTAQFAAIRERFERLEGRLDGVAADLKAHRADTEAHAAGYRVAEGGATGASPRT